MSNVAKVDVADLHSAFRTFAQLKTFIEGGSLLQILDVLRDIHLESARERLRNAMIATDPAREVEGAVDQLIVSKNIVRSTWYAPGVFGKLKDWANLNYVYNQVELEILLSMLIVACYVYLGDRECANLYVQEVARLTDQNDQRVRLIMGNREGSFSDFLRTWPACIVNGFNLRNLPYVESFGEHRVVGVRNLPEIEKQVQSLLESRRSD